MTIVRGVTLALALLLVSDAQSSLAEPPGEPIDFTLQKDGSVTLADGREIPEANVADELVKLLVQPDLPPPIVRLADARLFDSSAMQPVARALRLAKVRKIRVTIPGEEKPREFDLQPPRLSERILDDPDETSRAAAVADLLAAMRNPATRNNAMNEFVRVREVAFDRTEFLPIVREAAGNPNPKYVSKTHLSALGAAGGNLDDVPTILRHLDSPDLNMRMVVAGALYAVDPEAKHPGTLPAVEKLLRDPDAQHFTVKAMWGHPSSPAVDEILIELSHDKRIGYDTIYYALSTRPLVRPAVANRLIELSRRGEGRALWGMSHRRIAEDCRVLVGRYLLEVAEGSYPEETRCEAIWGLGDKQPTGAEAVLLKLLNADRSERVREAAGKALRRVRAKVEDAPPAA